MISNMPTKNYTVEWAENKPTSTGKDRKIITIKDESGAHYENVTMWSDFPGFAEIAPGSAVQGDYKDDGKYRTLFPTRAPRAAGGATGGRGAGIQAQKDASVAAAQARTQEGVSKAQDRTELSIKVSGIMRDTTLVLTSFFPEIAHMEGSERTDEIKKRFTMIRDWYMAVHNQTKDLCDVPFTDKVEPKF